MFKKTQNSAKNPDKKEKKKWSKKKKIITGVIVVAALLIITIGVNIAKGMNSTTAVNATTLKKGDIQRTVSTTGTTESTEVTVVSDNTGLPVWSIDVSVGSVVNKGDRLCQLYNEQATEEKDKWVSVYATASGTITAINAKSGMAASGSLFTIENTNSLRISAKIKQSDLGSVRSGMAVIIKTDATGDKEYSGTLQAIAPSATGSTDSTGTATASGTSSSSNPEFKGIVSIDSDTSDLRIGMKTNLEIIVEEKQGVYSVDYSAITTDDSGANVVYVAADETNGVYTVKAVPVTTGIESDFAVEITGSGLSDGLPVITDISKVKPGAKVTLNQNTTSNTTSQAGAEDASS